MSSFFSSESLMLATCASKGALIISEYFSRISLLSQQTTYSAVSFEDWKKYFEQFTCSNNPDVFYAVLALIFSSHNREQLDKLIKKDLRKELPLVIDLIAANRHGSDLTFESILSRNIEIFSGMSDSEISSKFTSKLEVLPHDIMDLPTDCSVFYAKVNHGYWEYMRSVYDVNGACTDKFRHIDIGTKVRRLRTSGVTQCWGILLNRLYAKDSPSVRRGHVSLSISLTAGTEQTVKTIQREVLSPVARGAAVGLISLFDSVLPNIGKIQLGDGAGPKNLAYQNKLESFFSKYVADSEACVFVVPPHLKKINFINYDGIVYKFIVPPTKINETWESVSATLLGYLLELSARHRSITIIGQGASIVSLMILLYSDLDIFQNVRIRFFDLGKVLDLSSEKHLHLQLWAAGKLEILTGQSKNVFSMNENESCMLASIL